MINFLVLNFQRTCLYLPKNLYLPSEERVSILICKFCGDKQFDRTVERIRQFYPKSNITIFSKIPCKEDIFENLLYHQKRVDGYLLNEGLLKFFLKANILFSGD